MSSPNLPTPSGIGSSHLEAVLLFLGATVTGLLGLLGVVFTRLAPSQENSLAALRLLMEELQTRHAQDTALISELRKNLLDDKTEREAEVSDFRLRLLERDGEIRGLKQTRDSLLSIMKRLDAEVEALRNETEQDHTNVQT